MAWALAVGATPAAAAPFERTLPVQAAAPGETVAGIGRSFESGLQAGSLSRAERRRLLAELDRADAQALRPEAEAFLRGQLHFSDGAYDEAASAFQRAMKSAGKGPFQDDARFAWLAALEASGQDERAADGWAQWNRREASSPLHGEALLRQAWNAMRRGEPAEAGKVLDALVARDAWRTSDARVALARGTSHYLQQQYGDALAQLGERPDGAAAKYLAALCLRATGVRLKAAALFQDVADRHQGSPLRDHALLAKADIFLEAGDAHTATQAFDRVVQRVSDPAVRAEAELRAAGARFLAGDVDSAGIRLRALAARHDGTPIAARAQFLLGEVLVAQQRIEEAIPAYNDVLTRYFQHSVAASAQYRVARCLDALGRRADATGSYEAVVRGYPLEPEAPAAAYLAGVGLLEQGRANAAIPYFQLVLDRYASQRDARDIVVFAEPQHREMVDASLCLLLSAYHQTGNLGQLSGAPHLLLQKLPPSQSLWRAHALLFDADAMAAQGRLAEARESAARLTREYPDHPVGARAARLLAWVHSREGHDSLAIATEERLLARLGSQGDAEIVSAALLDVAHERFNQKRYEEAAGAYEAFLERYPAHARRLFALYQSGLCYLRLDRAGDALDRWEVIVRDSAAAPLAERAWARIGDLYFQAERYEDAKRSYTGLLQHFGGSQASALASLRLAQCDYNAGRDAAALEGYARTIERHPGTPAAREAARGTERALYRLSQAPDGAEVLADLVERYPGSPFAADAQFQIARRHYDAGRHAEAATAFRRVVSQFPSFSAADQAQFFLADAQAKAGLPAEARAAFEQFIAYFPESELAPVVDFRLGLLRFEARQFLEAAVAFEHVLTADASDEVRSASLYNLALCRRELGDTPGAIDALQQNRTAHAGSEHAAGVAYQLGDLVEAAGRPAEALPLYEDALGAGADATLRVELQFRIGRCREATGDVDGALAAYGSATKAGDKGHPYRLSALARSASLYEQRNEFQKALRAYRDIVRHAQDQELVAAAADRASQLEAGSKTRP